MLTSIMVIFFMFLFLLLSISNNISNKINSEPSSNEVKDLSIDACFMSHQFVEERLKSPSSAKFQNCYYAQVLKEGDVYIVYTYVESQNSFGAQIRTKYIASVRPTDSNGDYWKLVSLYFDE